jgi:phosphoesterase RecJ-like protein
MPTELTAVADAIRSHDRFLLVTHENPDGDALGSIRAMKLALDSIGKDTLAFLGGDMEIPRDLAFMPLDWLERDLPSNTADRLVLALDCATASRTAIGEDLLGRAPLVINVDHHHDNTRFGRINLIRPEASSTGEIVRDLLAELKISLTAEIAEALYVALVTDTGRFQYPNTTKAAHLMAAELFDAGVDVERRRRIFQEIYESLEFAKLKLLGKAFERAELYEGGRLVISHLLRSDFTELGVGEEYAEGLIDYLRAVDGAEMAATIREPPEPPDAQRRISMRSSSDELDVSAIARKRGGGGHRLAAGFSSSESIDEIKVFLRQEFVLAAARA